MENIIVLSFTISIVYFFTKFIEMRFIKQEAEPLKNLFRDSGFVFISSLLGTFIISQINSGLIGGGPDSVTASSPPIITPAFTGEPEF